MHITRSERDLLTWRALIGALMIVALAGIGWYGFTMAQRERLAAVAERGVGVMPFDLDRTTHVFQATPDGGVQQVIADDPSDTSQIALIRSHLGEEAGKFRRGDFGDPAAIHGAMMPGLAQLQQGFAAVDVTYSDLPDGAQIRYTARDTAMVAALHDWFQAQLSDHGGHAVDHPGH
jgi:hypothetical protein